MKIKQKRWIQSVLDTAKSADTQLPYQRGNRKAVARRMRAVAKSHAA